ncbi:MAG: type III pantothenate kinase, partial [Candidatus Krumholzibacteria bacterium]|nr:type III pantothenate kinase [Candidatus Krumholzibacteria bacterium]
MAWILALDRGNESLKAALFDSGRIVGKWREEGASPEDSLRGIARALALDSARAAGAGLSKKDRALLLDAILGSVMFHSVVFSSVDPRWTKGIKRALDRMGASRVLEISAKIEFPFEILVEKPSKVGPDRLAAAAGVIAAGAREAIIVDAGTAITVDVLSKKGFLGGAIFPGTGLLYRALRDGTAALPLVTGRGGAADPPGRNTRDAIVAGVEGGAAGAVRELVALS